MQDTRPKNLNLFTIKFPLPAIVSIFHRVSGVFLFLMIPILLWLLQLSLTYDGFDVLMGWLSTFYSKLIFWLLLIPLCYHLVAGIRHLLVDIHIGEGRESGKRGALAVFIITFVLVILVGIWLW